MFASIIRDFVGSRGKKNVCKSCAMEPQCAKSVQTKTLAGICANSVQGFGLPWCQGKSFVIQPIKARPA